VKKRSSLFTHFGIEFQGAVLENIQMEESKYIGRRGSICVRTEWFMLVSCGKDPTNPIQINSSVLNIVLVELFSKEL